MDDVFQFAGVMLVSVGSLVGLIAGVRWAFGVGRRNPAPDDEVLRLRARVDHLERSLDVVAVEIERVGEAQRFTERVLAGGGPAVADGVRR